MSDGKSNCSSWTVCGLKERCFKVRQSHSLRVPACSAHYLGWDLVELWVDLWTSSLEQDRSSGIQVRPGSTHEELSIPPLRWCFLQSWCHEASHVSSKGVSEEEVAWIVWSENHLHMLFTLLAMSLQFKKLCCKPMSQKRVPLCWQRFLWSHCKRSKLQSCRLHRWKIRGMSRSSSRFVHFSDMFIVYVRQKTFAQATRPEDSRHMFFCSVVAAVYLSIYLSNLLYSNLI